MSWKKSRVTVSAGGCSFNRLAPVELNTECKGINPQNQAILKVDP